MLRVLYLLVACGDDAATVPDAGSGRDGGDRDAGDTTRDAGPDPGTDAGSSDAGRPFDAGPLVMGTWEDREELMFANSECAVAELDGLIYVIGGYPSDRVTVDTVQVYDVAADRWSVTTPVPQPINHTVAAAANGRVFVLGGQTDASGEYVDDVFAYDPATEEWTTRAPMPAPRSAGAAAVIGDLIYVAGGRAGRGADFAVYDAVADEWTELPPMPTARNHLAVGAIDGRVYVAGGRFGEGFTSDFTDVLEIYDPATRTWSTGAPMPTPRSGVNGIGVGGCFYVWGGEWAMGVFDENEVYHAASNTWRSLAPLPRAVHGVTGSAYVGGFIYAPGGGTSMGGSSGSFLHQVFRAAGTCPP
jgi:hypothetical protein